MKKINVLSLFDGMSCGQETLKELGIEIENYYASEVHKPAILVTKHRHPNTIHVGDVRQLYGRDFAHIQLLIGGSPCQNFSMMGYRKGMTTKSKEIVDTLTKYLELKSEGFKFEGQSYLYWEYVRLYTEINRIKIVRGEKPLLFMLENVKMQKHWADIISKGLNVEPIRIKSSLLGAARRDRYYWTNIPGVTVPKDMGILLGDVIQGAVTGYGIRRGEFPKGHPNFYYRHSKTKGNKANTVLTTIGGGHYGTNNVYMEDGTHRGLTIEECEMLQGLKPGYTKVEGVAKTQRMKMIGNGWDVNVIKHIFKNLITKK